MRSTLGSKKQCESPVTQGHQGIDARGASCRNQNRKKRTGGENHCGHSGDGCPSILLIVYRRQAASYSSANATVANNVTLPLRGGITILIFTDEITSRAMQCHRASKPAWLVIQTWASSKLF